MSEYFIITSKKYAQHATLKIAEAECERLRALLPEKRLEIRRCKTALHSAFHFPKMVKLLRTIMVDGGLTDETTRKARDLLQSIETRTPHLATESEPAEREAA